MTRIGVVDHGAGNLVSIAQSLQKVGAEVVVTSNPADVADCDGLVVPGVGTTRGVMDGIDAAGFRPTIRDWTRPLLGICVGMQVLFDRSDEDNAECFGFMSGAVVPLRNAPRLPHIGWNDVTNTPNPLFEGCEDATFYFVHSFVPAPADPAVTIGTTTYGTSFTAAVYADNRWGTQFHPERSGEAGLRLLGNFATACT